MSKDAYFSTGPIWGFRWLDLLDPIFLGKWVITVSLPSTDTISGIHNFPAVVDDFGSLIVVPR